MNKQWERLIITEVNFAMYVAPHTGKTAHQDRPYHGLVLNDSDSVKDYCFSDGRVMRTEGGCLFYLPKGSSYQIKTYSYGGCYAINFDADIEDEPFSVILRNPERVAHDFKLAASACKSGADFRYTATMLALYNAVYQAQKEAHREYLPTNRTGLIEPALRKLNSDFTGNDLTVAQLAELCGMSEVYFRKLFLNSLGVPPKEYMIQKRMEYAKTLLLSGNFSVAEAAIMCGYAEPCHFSREFKKRFGISPKNYK